MAMVQLAGYYLNTENVVMVQSETQDRSIITLAGSKITVNLSVEDVITKINNARYEEAVWMGEASNYYKGAS